MGAHMTIRRTQAFLLAVIAVGAALPSHSSAQTALPRSPLCRPLLIPGELVSEVEDFLVLERLCAGEPLRIEIEEESEKTLRPGRIKRKESLEVEVRQARTAASDLTAPRAEPQDLDAEDLARFGFETTHEETVEIRETGDSRIEEREEKTTARGDGFRYRSEDSEKEADEPSHRSDTEDSEQELDVRGR